MKRHCGTKRVEPAWLTIHLRDQPRDQFGAGASPALFRHAPRRSMCSIASLSLFRLFPHGGTTYRRASRVSCAPRSKCVAEPRIRRQSTGAPSAAPECHSSLSTGLPDNACKVIGAMNCAAAGVMTTSTAMPSLTSKRVSSAALYAATPPVRSSTTRRSGGRLGLSSFWLIDEGAFQFTMGCRASMILLPPTSPRDIGTFSLYRRPVTLDKP